MASNTVAMVTYCVLKMITCSPMNGQFFYTMIVDKSSSFSQEGFNNTSLSVNDERI